MSEQPAPVLVPVYPINPDRGKGLRKAGVILTAIGGTLGCAILVMALIMAGAGGGANPMLMIIVAVIWALPLLITGLILWLVGRGMIHDTAAKLAFMAQQAGGTR
ncbi:hypothetical protein [Galactobacter valiniphilus]|uniref:hypothetical protein n=1 Tax=Galactobacter valiniphilus TaxID=2676122 RepID=UPI0037359DA2